MKHDPNELKTQGFIIDNTCYPWVAYKGPRFNPTEFFWCYTDEEARLREWLKRILDEPVGRRYYDMGGYDECRNCEDMQDIARAAMKEVPSDRAGS